MLGPVGAVVAEEAGAAPPARVEEAFRVAIAAAISAVVLVSFGEARVSSVEVLVSFAEA